MESRLWGGEVVTGSPPVVSDIENGMTHAEELGGHCLHTTSSGRDES